MLDNVSFLDRVSAAAEVFRSHGIGRGDVIAVILPNRGDLVVTLFAAWRIGAAVTPVNPQLTEGEARHQIEDSGARLVVGDRSSHALVTVDVTELRSGRPDASEPPRGMAAGRGDGSRPRGWQPATGMAAGHGDGSRPSRRGGKNTAGGAGDLSDLSDLSDLTDDALALLIYTSGTTGRPKGVMLDHANIAAMCDMIIRGLGLDEDDHSLLILPLFHVNGIVVSVLSPLLAGGRVTIAGRFRPAEFFPTVERVRPTYFSAVPAIYAMLVSLPSEVRPDTVSLRRAICGAAPMPAELILRFESRFGVPVVEGYGLSEGTCASTLNPPAGPRKPGTVGLPLPGQQVALMDQQGDLLTATGSSGEVVVRGPNVMRGYLGQPEATARTVIDGWLHTGDVGRFDEDGYLVLVDRIKDMIIRGGENIYPKEIENALYAHPAVLEAAVVGGPDPVLGEVPVAYVALTPGTGAGGDDLIKHCAASLTRFKVPVAVHIVDQLPKNPVGKIDKPTIRKRLGTPSV